MSSTVRVSNLPAQPNTVETVQQLFESFGNILQLTQHSSSSSYIDVQFQDIGDAQEAVNNMEGFELFGKYLHVSKIKESDDSNAVQHDKKPVWEQEQWVVCAATAMFLEGINIYSFFSNWFHLQKKQNKVISSVHVNYN